MLREMSVYGSDREAEFALSGLRFGLCSVLRAKERLVDSADPIPIAAGLHDLRTLRAIEQSNECDSRSDGQEVA